MFNRGGVKCRELAYGLSWSLPEAYRQWGDRIPEAETQRKMEMMVPLTAVPRSPIRNFSRARFDSFCGVYFGYADVCVGKRANPRI